jgi:thiamine biosynthesis lipoprotein
VVVEGHALGTFAQVKCSPTITSTEVEQIILNIDREAKSSMSIFDQSSLLSKINNNECDSLDRHILINLELAKRYHELSNGYYDVTVKPLTSAWGFAQKSEMVEKPNIDSLIEFVGFDKISIDDGRIIKSDSRIQIDLNSIAKGYTVDLVAQRLDNMGIEDYMINIGGEIRCKGHNAKGNKWTIAIETPYDGNMSMDSFQKIIHIDNQAVATSGNYRRFYLAEDGSKVAHTMDPRTGYSKVTTLLSATVVAPTCAEADAAATMFMSIGTCEEVTQLASQCETEYGWKYYFIFAEGEEYRVVCSEEYR